jgi:hypothetical protein
VTVNAQIDGELKVRLVDTQGRPLAGFGWVSLRGDELDHAVRFEGSLSSLKQRAVRLEFELVKARLFGFDLLPGR